MYFLENEVLLRAAISNIAELRGTKVKFKGFTMDSYRRSLNTHFRKLLGSNYSMSFNSDSIRIRIPGIDLFDKNPIDDNTKRVTDLIQAPYVSGKMGTRLHPFFAYNASERIQDLFTLRNYMAQNEYLFHCATTIDSYIFNSSATNVTYQIGEVDPNTDMAEEKRRYHKFVRDLAFEYPACEMHSYSSVPELNGNSVYIYHYRENMFLVNLGSTAFDPDRSTGLITVSIPVQALLDREFLTLLAKACGSFGNNDD